ncbi:MAG: UDP-4-amino-4,6-dideoxy-N-acetyl-beta-L-altrosamine transaminase [Chloroflexi bacterium]|nr:UDP-4-amino-4,6-dideoxy-N-acetyl-beta-L-altrosamine transaminase [Ardenticatenaceae bacterium]MBL1128103.1 UDP-4-amino-4,6-dideoxy-N-acetyl-beta-L-altrosamine transaminase [Chloroflexota bacterium]NOG34174.1 UDP-4-amino-4,6-dideoxy-N-acetyl-beta-L-altrosamine transaminase [Chloroflexota bacterium]
MLPYGRQWIDEDDITAVTAVLRSDWLTTGPNVPEFETAFAGFVGAREAVAVSNGTAALHAAMHALGLGPGDEVIVPAMTFAASANCVVYQGGTPVFADVQADTLLIDPDDVAAKITARTKAIVAVDYAGQPCDYERLHTLARQHGLKLVADACHAIGGAYREMPVGALADLNTFSLHPVKHITTGEGGVITTNDPELARRMRVFRNHGITTDHRQRAEQGAWFYEMVELGYNYRLTDFQCALGLSQLRKLPGWVARRQAIARTYDAALAGLTAVAPLTTRPEVSHAYHLYVVRFDLSQLTVDRNTLFQALRAEGMGVNLHYIPVHLHPFYRQRLGTRPGLCPAAEAAYAEILSLPIFPQMSDEDVPDVITAVSKVVEAYRA